MTVSAQIIEVLNTLGQKFGIAIDWTQENVFPYLQQLSEKYIAYERSTSIVWIVFMAVIFAIAASIAVLAWASDWPEDAAGGLTVLAVITFVIAACVCLSEIFDLVACKNFPEKLIFRYVQSLLR